MTADLLLPLDEAGPVDRRSLEARASDTECDLAWTLYLEMATRCGLPIPSEKSPARVKSIKKRLADHGGIAKWRVALDAVEHSRDLRGENRRGFKAHIDYVTNPKYYVQLIEGVFDRDFGKPMATKASGKAERSPLDTLRAATPEEIDMQRRLFNELYSDRITPRQADWYRHQDDLRTRGKKMRWRMVVPPGWTRPA